MSAPPNPSKRPQAASRRSDEAKPHPNKQKKRQKIPTVDLHIQIDLIDMLIRISAADFQRFINHWVLSEETIILRGPYDGMENDLVLRGTASGSYSIRSYPEGAPRPKVHGYKLVIADEVRMEMLKKAGL